MMKPLARLILLMTLPLFSLAAECDEGSVSAFAAGDAAATFGAESADLCAEFCIPEMALQFVPGAQAGSCADQGYPTEVVPTQEVQLPGSPMPLSVTIYGPGEDTTTTNTDEITVDQWAYPQPSSFEGPCVDCPEYVALSGEEKLDLVWDKIMAYEYEELPTNWLHTRTDPTVSEMIADFPDKTRVNMIFDRVSDERPPNFPRLLHEYGSIAKIAFEAKPGHNFTGLYGEGNEFGIIRITFCAPFDGERSGSRVPFAFAAKFFRNGIHSSNVPTCEGPDRDYRGRDPKGFGVFHHLLHTSSIISPPIDVFFANAQNGTGPLSIADNTWFTHDGTPVQDFLSPLIIHFFPNEALNTKDAYEEDFRKELVEVPANTTLYTAYTPVDDEGNPIICICHSTPEGEIPCFNRESLAGTCRLVELGSIVSRSQFVHSDYGDNGILFKHYRSCEEDRKYCQYNQPIPEIDSTFTKSALPNGTCVSRRRVDDFDVCPFLEDGLELLETLDYCSSPDEFQMEKMCPFAQALHPAFSSSGVYYPISEDEHLRHCDVLNSAAVASKSAVAVAPVVSIACCRAVSEYFDEATKALGLQSLCNMADCRAEFELAFPEEDLTAECADVDPVSECKFELKAGPSTIPINLGFVTEDCCSAVQAHSGGGDTLDVVCQDESCILAYESLFQQGQMFTNPGSNQTLEEVCSSTSGEEKADENTTTSGKEPEKVASSGGALLPISLFGTLAAIVSLAI